MLCRCLGSQKSNRTCEWETNVLLDGFQKTCIPGCLGRLDVLGGPMKFLRRTCSKINCILDPSTHSLSLSALPKTTIPNWIQAFRAGAWFLWHPGTVQSAQHKLWSFPALWVLLQYIQCPKQGLQEPLNQALHLYLWSQNWLCCWSGFKETTDPQHQDVSWL